MPLAEKIGQFKSPSSKILNQVIAFTPDCKSVAFLGDANGNDEAQLIAAGTGPREQDEFPLLEVDLLGELLRTFLAEDIQSGPEN